MKGHRRTVHHYTRWTTISEVDPPVLMEQLNLEAFTEEGRIRHTEVMLVDAFMDAPNRRTQIPAACAILRGRENPLRFTYIAIGVFLGGLSQGVVQGQGRKASRPA
jgi:hypothetical protein